MVLSFKLLRFNIDLSVINNYNIIMTTQGPQVLQLFVAHCAQTLVHVPLVVHKFPLVVRGGISKIYFFKLNISI